MRLTRRQLWTIASTIYLLALTALAAYALHSANELSLPVPNILSALGVALPPLAGLALETSLSITTSVRAKSSPHVRSYVLQIVSATFFIYETVLATLAGTHLAPAGSLNCALREQWMHLYRSKDASSIRGIQDRFDCCGYESLRDMPWPFPEQKHGIDAGTCVARFQRTLHCLEPWKDAEKRVASLLLAVAIAVFVWQLLFLYIGPEQSPSWLPSTIRLPYDAAMQDPASQRQIAYRDEEESRDESSVAGAVRGLNADSRLASHIEGGRNARAHLQDDNAWLDRE